MNCEIQSYGETQDRVDETLSKYGPQIGEVIEELRRQCHAFGRYQNGLGHVEAKYRIGDGIRRISLRDLRRVESRLRGMTGDLEACLGGCLRLHPDTLLTVTPSTIKREYI